VAQQLILKRASASRPSGEWNDDDYDVFAEGVVVGRISEAMRYLANVRRPMSYVAAFFNPRNTTRSEPPAPADTFPGCAMLRPCPGTHADT
jgi:hypothetical protein